ncbi:hypothetical protein [Nonomuraea fuscirosea]|uniref:hypothetical protein n=1 Tax=Nonomuraea fuscirosea TaxID=1291556 RepID=UPI0015E635D6|nr:hypothetical protein [Nonomuraea fuscirosea]
MAAHELLGDGDTVGLAGAAGQPEGGDGAVGVTLVGREDPHVAELTRAGDRLIGTYYGLYMLSGVGILLGNLLSGAMLDAARVSDWSALPWLLPAASGLVSAGAVQRLPAPPALSREPAGLTRGTRPQRYGRS